MTVEEQGEQEKSAAEKLIAGQTPFKGVEKVDVELGEDHSGEPSIWIVFRLESGFKTDESWIRDFNQYSTQLSLKLIHSGLTRFPYTRLETAA